ncbi:succinyl-diaminopimelate desuccinylase [Actinocrinis puniceicyclus]|uniref:Succinyl-diaminopimelate desuccinylase n=1 Tax=Actinocrinis puniceicyclus TaxID=977794 RepID=A0A8J7WRI9_9ACTN|nr:succinyl-diaminopimelate desuccinylase [Actinocrinis puniceicyclus]MBS2965142.1 succinyl-diaminopimelate desuccinylase [Actinocrinis puniceicyclus]
MTARGATGVEETLARAGDPVALTAALVAVASVSGREERLADLIERRLRTRGAGLVVRRIGNNVIARTEGSTRGRSPERIVFAGHLDTVPQFPGRTPPEPDPDTVAGLGAVDMKGGLAVMLLLAERAATANRHCTFVFYDKEETGSRGSGMNMLFAGHRELVAGDFAVLLEPTGGTVEAGCQGNLVVELGFVGRRAHTARPWRGTNAVHRAAPALHRIADFVPEPVVIDGLHYRQALSVVGVDGGVQGNVVPDSCTVRVNYRHAPSLDSAAATRVVLDLAPEADSARVLLDSPPAAPSLSHPLAGELLKAAAAPPRPKLGWTDVGRFAQHGVPAANFGPGDSELAHTPDETVTRADLERAVSVLRTLLA